MMEPILLEIAPGGSYIEDDPHQGEEFGYVIQGNVTVVRRKEVQSQKGESFYYKTKVDHTIVNSGG